MQCVMYWKEIHINFFRLPQEHWFFQRVQVLIILYTVPCFSYSVSCNTTLGVTQCAHNCVIRFGIRCSRQITKGADNIELRLLPREIFLGTIYITMCNTFQWTALGNVSLFAKTTSLYQLKLMLQNERDTLKVKFVFETAFFNSICDNSYHHFAGSNNRIILVYALNRFVQFCMLLKISDIVLRIWCHLGQFIFEYPR